MVGKRPYLLFSPFIRLHPFTHFILGESSQEPMNRESGTLGPCTRNGASPLCDSGKGDAPLWDSIPSSVKRGVRLDNLCSPFSANKWWLDVFFDSLIRSKKPALSLNRRLEGGLYLRTSALWPTLQRTRLTAQPTSAGQKRACRGRVSHL